MKKNILGVFTLSLLVLMGTGVAFGHWQDWVYVDGIVETGTMDVVPSYEGSEFDWFNYKPYAPDGVAWDDCYVDGSTIYINLYNVYPAVCWYGTFNLENNGTVPAGFYDLTATSNPELTLVSTGPWEWNVFYIDMQNPIANLSLVQRGTGNSTLCQIDPGYPVYFDIQICFKNPLPQNSTFNFALTLEFWNWNEVCLDARD